MYIYITSAKAIHQEVKKMYRKYFGLTIILIIFSSLNPVFVWAEGWGYKKNNDHIRPDIGKYAKLLDKHQAFYVDETDEKVLYLTFDNGYEQGYTEQVLDVLKKQNIPATFFVTGHYVKSEPGLVKRMSDDGHIIGNHSNTHPDFTKMSKENVKQELDTLEKYVAEITDQKKLTYLRPPRGTFNEDTLSWADELGYVHVFWSLAFKDWETDQQKGWKYAYDQILSQIHPGAVLLLHTVSEDNAEALDKVITELKEQGYTFKSLDDLMIKEIIPEDILF